MNIYITYERTFFTEKQIKTLEQYGNLIFLENYFDLDKAQYLHDSAEKILMADPEWYKWNLRKEHISKIKNLKAICINTTAFDWIDWQYCKENGIIVTHTPKYSTDSVAEYAIFLMMCLAKKLPIQIKTNYKMVYNHEMLNTEIKNKTVGIIGLGTIGTRVAELCDNLGMKVIYWSKSIKENKYKRVEIDDIFKESDFIIPTFATNEDTRKIITDKRIAMMNGNSIINIIINPVEIYNHKLMLEKAENNEISYAFEIYDDKTLNDYNGNVMATAPYSFYTKESIDRLVDLWCNNTMSILENKSQNVVGS
jgi:lactate dehydrogenase-like 2-hydroxyacid dehydrogenase